MRQAQPARHAGVELVGIDPQHTHGSTDRPADLGYYIGYKIAASYYERAPAKSQAVRDILTVRDYPAFLEASGYEEKFAASP